MSFIDFIIGGVKGLLFYGGLTFLALVFVIAAVLIHNPTGSIILVIIAIGIMVYAFYSWNRGKEKARTRAIQKEEYYKEKGRQQAQTSPRPQQGLMHCAICGSDIPSNEFEDHVAWHASQKNK
ncbi:MAG: hypothetical protein KGI06_03060 [Candidatus Micrarchaeota archaeon]|nr:hypothetical protein [Candidatus Micrarchaeota archaeon]